MQDEIDEEFPDWLRPFNPEEEKRKIPESYTIKEVIKAPLNFLMYNVNALFVDNYPAKMIPQFAKDMITFYSKKGDVVWDGFCGSGTVPRMANKLGRIGIGTDVNPKAIDLCKRHDPEHAEHYWVDDLATVNLKHYKPKLIVTSPPFGVSIGGDKNNYSTEKDDISNSPSIEVFLERFKPLLESYYHNLQPNGLLVMDSRDRTKGAKYYDLSRLFANLAVEIGFSVHAVYHIFLMPWQLYTFFQKDNKEIMPNVSFLDVYVFYKPKNKESKLGL